MRKIESGNFKPEDIDLFQDLQWAYAKLIVTRPLAETFTLGEGTADAESRVDQATARLRKAGYDVESRIVPGEPERAICAAVENDRINLLVMGAYGHSRIRNLIVGSTTTAMIRSCKIPIVLFR